MHCTQCGNLAEGRFCGNCGATLAPMDCLNCSTPVAEGRRFCHQCGSPLREEGQVVKAPPGTAQGANLGWWVSGGLLVILLVVGGWVLTGEGGTGAQASGPEPGALGAAPNVDLASMTPREAADRLFDRVMVALSQQDSTEVMNFLPMALDAYELAEPLDLDGLFHVSLLQRAGLRYEEALATAQEGLEEDPDHLLLLSAAADAALDLGRTELAEDYYRQALEVWDEETVRDDREEYREHAPVLPRFRSDAEDFIAGSEG
jgi:hypothetical protein